MTDTRKPNADRISTHFKGILEELGEDVTRDGLLETPQRVARMWIELTSGLRYSVSDLASEVKTFVDGEVSGQVVTVVDIHFSSICEHHCLPFSGYAHVAYIPNGKGIVPGLSKVARVLDRLAKRPQLQERLTGQLYAVLQAALEPTGLLVVLDASHGCMVCRGVKKIDSRTRTLKFGGAFEEQAELRRDAIHLIESRSA